MLGTSQSSTSQAITKYFCLKGLSCKNLVVQFSVHKSDPTKLLDGSGKFQPGLLTFDFAEVKTCNSSLLSLLPVQFEKFYAAVNGNGPDVPDFPDLGSVGFFPLHGNGPFDFAFSFRLPLGGLGGLISGVKKLEAEILLGWQAPLKGLVIGFRLPGGSLDLGIQGVLKLHIGEFQLHEDQSDTPYYALLLKDCRLSLLGMTLPNDDSLCDAVILPNPKDPLGSPVGWFGGVKAKKSGDKKYWGLGQRIAIQPKADAPLYFDNVLELLRDFVSKFIDAIHGDAHPPVNLKDFFSGSESGNGTLVYDDRFRATTRAELHFRGEEMRRGVKGNQGMAVRTGNNELLAPKALVVDHRFGPLMTPILHDQIGKHRVRAVEVVMLRSI